MKSVRATPRRAGSSSTVSEKGPQLKKARTRWRYWAAAASVTDLASNGVSRAPRRAAPIRALRHWRTQFFPRRRKALWRAAVAALSS
eukprot:4710017-Pyramimonas_sp.AAC.1